MWKLDADAPGIETIKVSMHFRCYCVNHLGVGQHFGCGQRLCTASEQFRIKLSPKWPIPNFRANPYAAFSSNGLGRDTHLAAACPRFRT